MISQFEIERCLALRKRIRTLERELESRQNEMLTLLECGAGVEDGPLGVEIAEERENGGVRRRLVY